MWFPLSDGKVGAMLAFWGLGGQASAKKMKNGPKIEIFT